MVLRITWLFYCLVFVYGGLWAQQKTYRLPKGITGQDYSDEVIIVKLSTSAVQNISGKHSSPISAFQITPALPHLSEINKSKSARAHSHPLENIYKVQLRKGDSPVKVINDLLNREGVEYAEPYFNHRPLFIPDDPDAQPTGPQWYLNKVSAYDAWTVEKGDSTLVIGIIDTGALIDHADLATNLFINTGDPINGVDDDGDGLIDNYYGWDLADNDNNPVSDNDLHGTGVAGVSNAATNNGKGIAGIGFNTKFMPIKIYKSTNNAFYGGYEAIALAADLGCDVINLSWGSPNSFSHFGQDIIDYVVNEKDVVVVAAAGNTPNFLDFYPASFDHVLSVGATNQMDEKASFGTISYKIDLVAPGEGIYVIDGNDLFTIRNGTSYSAPMVAGTAALLRSRFPNLSARQIMEKIRVNTDDIYAITANQPYTDLLGSGRLNTYRALTNSTSPSLRLDAFTYSNGSGKYAYYGDTLEITLSITNFLFPTSNARATINSNSPYVEIINGEFSMGQLNTMENKNNQQDPFIVRLSDDLPPDEDLYFSINYTDGAYKDVEYFKIESSPNFINASSNDLALTVSSDGELGYALDSRINGVGITLSDQKILDNIGFALSSSNASVIDNMPNTLLTHSRDHDFEKQSGVKYYRNSIAPLDIRNQFISKATASDNLLVEQKILGWNTSDYLILEYRITNIGTSAINTLQAGIFADWDLNSKNFNAAYWDNDKLFGYVEDVQSQGLFAGIALLNSSNPIYYAIDNKNFNGNSADISATIDDGQKFSLLSQGIAETTAGTAGSGNDVSHIIGNTLNDLQPNESRKIAFVLTAGYSLAELHQAIEDANTNYQAYNNTPPLLTTSTTCPGQPASINPVEGTIFDFYADVNKNTLLYTGETFITPPVNADQIYYVVNKDEAYESDLFRVIARSKAVNADFSMSSNPLLLDETNNTAVEFIDLSLDGANWDWDFGNGFKGNNQNPIMHYEETGNYNVTLSVTSDIGCEETLIKILEVANRSQLPDIQDQNICKGDDVVLSATNATNLIAYKDSELNNVVATGESINLPSITTDTVIYITSMDSVYESNPKKVIISVSPVTADFHFYVDSTNLAVKQRLHLLAKSTNETMNQWRIDGALLSDSDSIAFDYNNVPFTIELLATDADGCEASKVLEITPGKSVTPVLNNQTICLGGSAQVVPDGIPPFLFYNDPLLTTPIKKGNFIKLNNLTRDTTLYITSIADLIESEAGTITVEISNIKASFTLSADSLDIKDLTSLSISQESQGADQFSWWLNDVLISEAAVPDLLPVSSVGKYSLRLMINNQLGCTDSASEDLIVTNITGLHFIDGEITVHPIPANDLIMISGNNLQHYIILNGQGKLVQQGQLKQSSSVALDHLNDGIYLLKVQAAGHQQNFRIVKTSN